MPSQLVRLIARVYPKGQERNEFLESVASDLHYSVEVGVPAGQIRRGAMRQALAYAWRHPRIGTLVAVLGLLFSAWFGLISSGYDFKLFAVSCASWLMQSWVVAVLLAKFGNGTISKIGFLGWFFTAAAYFVHFKEWRFGGTSMLCVDGRVHSYCTQSSWGVRTDLSTIIWPLLILAGLTYVWLAVSFMRQRDLKRATFALAFAPLQGLVYLMLHQGFGSQVPSGIIYSNVGPLAISAVSWPILFAATFWHLGHRAREAKLAQR